MDKDEVNTIVQRIVSEQPAGMSSPREDDGVRTAAAEWKSVDKNSLPLVDLGCPTNRAEKHKPTAGSAWTAQAMRKARDEFLVSGVVAFVPEVSRN